MHGEYACGKRPDRYWLAFRIDGDVVLEISRRWLADYRDMLRLADLCVKRLG